MKSLLGLLFKHIVYSSTPKGVEEYSNMFYKKVNRLKK